MTTQQNDKGDVLGLQSLETIVQRLVSLKTDNQELTRFAFIIEQLESQLDDTKHKYELLKDRYSLLKRHNAALFDELSWLRDQIDDLSLE